MHPDAASTAGSARRVRLEKEWSWWMDRNKETCAHHSVHEQLIGAWQLVYGIPLMYHVNYHASLR